MTFPGINRLTLREQVWASLREEILEGRLPAGARLAEVELADQLKVSRGTVREALRRLQQSGLVQGEDRLGLSVTTFTPEEVVELFEVRGALESLAGTRIIREGRHEEAADQLEEKLPEFPEGTAVTTRLDIDLGFHELLCELSGSQTLVRMWCELKDRMCVAILADQSDARLFQMQANFHRPIVDALRSGDPARFDAVIMGHMDDAARTWSLKAVDA
ncbi:GntR family transcriptional regulator [Schaalia sp. 19OD2882]|uniref:GntR family transcriptional regulator n=1 Tax=Schaalia sp. 19OD2882 TaxID=2794089 RepID=UPI001C1EF76C|nr:GntR family transcriptional regulator [Schaalia sp. 19OD2882]QWW18712.1 GntR family transcriptional regulator [Schaalia sp. 19OD2882]